MYVPPKNSRKGENGRLLIIAGSREYHGAAMLAILGARRFVDLVYFYPAQNDLGLIFAVKSIPEAIVVSDLKVETDCVLFGNGIGNARFDIRKLEGKTLVVDAEGLKRIIGNIPKGALLTPHEGEFRMLFGLEGSEKNVKEMAKKHSCIILKKGALDIISDGKRVVKNRTGNPGMTKGGTGDVLAGLVAALSCKNSLFDAAVEGAKIAGKAGNRLMKKYGYNYCASDLAEEIPRK
jgi:NAD(P)H-hydrate epimerase